MQAWAGVLNSGRYAECKKANYKWKDIVTGKQIGRAHV